MPRIELPSIVINSISAVVDAPVLLLANRNPEPNESNVSINNQIELEIINTGTSSINTSTTQVWIGGTLAFNSNIQSGYNGPDSAVTQTTDSLKIILDPVAPFASQAIISIRVVTQTSDGLNNLDETYTFNIEDRTAPHLLAAIATSQDELKIEFDEAIGVVDLNGLTFTSLDLPAVPIYAASAKINSELVTIKTNTIMTPDVRYELIASNIKDVYGNIILPPYDTAIFKGFRPQSPINRKFDLWSMLPKMNRRMDETGDLKKFISCLQEITDLILAEVDRFSDIFDLERAGEIYIDLILADLGNPFDFDLTELEKRCLADMLVELYRQKGTSIGIKNAIRFFMGLEVEIVSYTGETMVLGESELGVDWILGPSNSFALYSFNISVDQVLTDKQREQIREIVEFQKPAHTHFIDLIEPQEDPAINYWILGVSELNGQTYLN